MSKRGGDRRLLIYSDAVSKVPVHATSTITEVSLQSNSIQHRRHSPVGGSALQCDTFTPHNPNRPSLTGDCIRKALARPPLRRHNEVICDEGGSLSGTRRERRLPLSGLTVDERLTPCVMWVLESRGESRFSQRAQNRLDIHGGGSAMTNGASSSE